MEENKKRVPELRFPEFTEEWEKRKLDVVTDVRDGTHDSPQYVVDGYPLITSKNLKGGYVNYDDVQFISDKDYEEINKRSRVDKNDILMGMIGTVGNIALVRENPNFAIKNVALIKNTGQVFYCYLYHYLQSPSIMKQLSENLDGGTQKFIALNKIRGLNIAIPSNDEQYIIGNYMEKVDDLIDINQRKLDHWKEVKKGLLQKMFPKKGAKVPEVRFPEFTDEWEQRKLDDWGTFYYGRSCPKWSVTEDATIPCIRYGELYTKFGAKIEKIYSYTNMPSENLRFSKGKEVLIPRVGEDPMDYNHCTWLSIPNVAIGEMISVFNTENNPLFTAIMFNATLQNEFAMRVEGGSVTNLYFEKLKNIDVLFPKLNEQEKIADYFQSIDHLITLHQRKLDHLKELKKGLLQKMFV